MKLDKLEYHRLQDVLLKLSHNKDNLLPALTQAALEVAILEMKKSGVKPIEITLTSTFHWKLISGGVTIRAMEKLDKDINMASKPRRFFQKPQPIINPAIFGTFQNSAGSLMMPVLFMCNSEDLSYGGLRKHYEEAVTQENDNKAIELAKLIKAHPAHL